MSLKKAIELAKGNPIEGLPKHAALIYDGKRLVAYGLNSRKTHPLQFKFGRNEKAIHLHSEVAALVNAREDVSGMTMYVARVNKKGEPMLSKPCTGCQNALIAFGLKDVVWTGEEPNDG